MDEGTSRARLDAETDERFIPLRRQLGVSSFGINQMVFAPGQRGRIHIHEHQEEVLLVLAGELTVAIEGEEETLGEGELIRIAPVVRRQLLNRSREKAVVLALGADGEHHGRDATAFESWEAEEGGPPQEVPLPEDLDLG